MNKIILSGLLALLVSACATRSGPAPVEESEVESRIRQAARDDSNGVQVFPLRNPAVDEFYSVEFINQHHYEWIDMIGGHE